MNSSIIIAIVGAMVLTTSTVAFGATLTTPLEFNLIGSSENVAVTAARANVTAIDFVTEVGEGGIVETDGINFSVGNEDPVNAHIFEICLVMEGPTDVFNPAVGSPPACTTTSSIPANSIITGELITMTNGTSVEDLLNVSISIEETT